MPLAVAQDVLKASYRGQCAWLLACATELEAGDARIVRRVEGKEVDVSAHTAIEYRHRAANLEHIIQAYERIDAKES